MADLNFTQNDRDLLIIVDERQKAMAKTAEENHRTLNENLKDLAFKIGGLVEQLNNASEIYLKKTDYETTAHTINEILKEHDERITANTRWRLLTLAGVIIVSFLITNKLLNIF